MSSCFSAKVRKAKVAHKCYECHQPINPGDQYRYSSGIWGGEPLSFKQCLTCAGIMNVAVKINQENGSYQDEGPSFGNLIEWVVDEIDCCHEQIDRFEFNGNPVWMKVMERYKDEDTK